MTQGYDYIVVGAGAAGCVVAARLSEDPSARVLLLEAGAADDSLSTTIPLLTFMASADAKRNWSFETEPIPELNGRRQVWSQGRGLGGSSSINGMIYMRGHPREYDAWNCPGWSWAELEPHFKRSEGNSRGEGPWHGGDGPLKVRPSRLDLPICDAFIAALADDGCPAVEDLNAGVEEGVGRFDCNIDDGVRMGARRAYLTPAQNRANLTVQRDALALRIRFDGTRAVAVETLCGGDRRDFHAEREIILCGGALNSPSLLLASGVGPAAHLAEVGVEMVADAPEVGENLRNHPAHFDQYLCDAPVTAYSYMSPLAAMGAGASYLFARKGPLAEGFSTVGGFLRSDPSLEFADTIVVMIPSLLQRAAGASPRWWDLLPKRNGFMVATALGRTHGAGRLRLRSADPTAAPSIYPEFFNDPRDMSALVHSVQRVRRALRNDPIARYITNPPPPGFDDEAAIETSIRGTAGSLSHPSGTCRLGADARAVVDLELRVNGVEGLRVADNSVMPNALNACTHAPAIMIGEKAASLIAGNRAGSARALVH